MELEAAAAAEAELLNDLHAEQLKEAARGLSAALCGVCSASPHAFHPSVVGGQPGARAHDEVKKKKAKQKKKQKEKERKHQVRLCHSVSF